LTIWLFNFQPVFIKLAPFNNIRIKKGNSIVPKEKVFFKYVYDEMSKFKNPEEVLAFIKTLNEDQISFLCNCLTNWRDNGVYKFIADGPSSWEIVDVPISKIFIGEVNDTINPLLEKNDFHLEKIAQDKEICEHKEFEPQGEITSKTFIAAKSGDTFKMKDGIHRIIRAACDGQKEFKLLCY
jgi:hypothetical protein